IGRSITRPLNGLVEVMRRLADGDTTARIPATGARDEIGEMARTVIVFRDNIIEREKLATIQAETSLTQVQRNESISRAIAQFKQSVQSALGRLRGASVKLEASSSDLNKSDRRQASHKCSATNRSRVRSHNSSNRSKARWAGYAGPRLSWKRVRAISTSRPIPCRPRRAPPNTASPPRLTM